MTKDHQLLLISSLVAAALAGCGGSDGASSATGLMHTSAVQEGAQEFDDPTAMNAAAAQASTWIVADGRREPSETVRTRAASIDQNSSVQAFESAFSALPEGWYINHSGAEAPQYEAGQDALNFHGGSSSLRFSLQSVAADAQAHLAYPVALATNKRYTAVVWLRASAPTDVVVKLQADSLDAPSIAGTRVTIGQDWTAVEISGVHAATDSAASLRIAPITLNTVLFVDDVLVTEGALPSKTAPRPSAATTPGSSVQSATLASSTVSSTLSTSSSVGVAAAVSTSASRMKALAASATTPWVEFENGTVGGGAGVQASSGASGGKAVGALHNPGAFTEVRVDAGNGGTYDIALRHSNGNGWNSQLSFYVAGQKVARLTLPPTGSWNTFAEGIRARVTLPAGVVTLRLQHAAGDVPGINADRIRAVLVSAAAAPAPAPAPATATSGEFETGARGGTAAVETLGSASGGKAVGSLHTQGSFAEVTLDGGAGGSFDLSLRYANGNPWTSVMSLYVAGREVARPSMPTTGSWTTFAEANLGRVTLPAGKVAVRLQLDAGDVPGITADRLQGTPAGSASAPPPAPAPAPTAALPPPAPAPATSSGSAPANESAVANWNSQTPVQLMAPYKRLVVVNASNSAANDNNPGTAASPLRTIAAAMSRLQPGDDVVIMAGTYREPIMVPGRAWNGQQTRIRGYGATVIKGSYVVGGFRAGSNGVYWVDWSGEEPQQVFQRGRALKQIGGTVFGGFPTAGNNPLNGMHASEGGIWPGRVNGGVAQLTPGTFTYVASERRVYVKPAADGQGVPGDYELSVHRHVLSIADGSGITVQGLVFDHSNTTTTYRQGAVKVGGSGNVVQHSVIRNMDGQCVGLGGSSHAVKNNYIADCGQVGIAGTGNLMRIEGNTVLRANFRGFNKWWEAGGMKFVGAADFSNGVITGNTVLESVGDGIWVDWEGSNNLIENNVSSYNQGFGIHYEMSASATVRGNYTYGNTMRGIYLIDGGSSVVERNSIFGNTYEGLSVVETSRSSGGSPYEPRNVRIIGNTVAWNDFNRNWIQMNTPPLAFNFQSDRNVFIAERLRPRVSIGWMTTGSWYDNLAAWRSRTGDDVNSAEQLAPMPENLRTALQQKRLIAKSEMPAALANPGR